MKKILIVEDNEGLRKDIIRVANRECNDCECIEASTVEKATDLISRVFFALVITHLKLPEEPGKQSHTKGGIKVVKLAKQRDSMTQVIVITSFPKSEAAQQIRKLGILIYVNRTLTTYLDFLALEIIHALQSFQQARKDNERSVVLTLPGQKQGNPSIRRSGFDVRWSRKPLELDFDVLKAATAAIGSLLYVDESGHRQAMSKFVGRHIWNRIFRDHEVLLRTLGEAQGASLYDTHLVFKIASNSDALDLPLELLHDGSKYLALRHPFVRTVQGSNSAVRTGVWFQSMIEKLRNDHEPFRFLLIASDTFSENLGPIPMVDQEVETIHKLIRGSVPYGPVPLVDVLHTWEVKFRNIMEKLKEGYHVIHYAGHGIYDDDRPDNSGLYVWEKSCEEDKWRSVVRDLVDWYTASQKERRNMLRKVKELRGKLCRIDTGRLSARFIESPPSLIYLSCCHSARTGEIQDLVFSHSLGMMDAIVKAGVPAVVGHRWPLSDSEITLEFVQIFYQKLLADFSPEQAMFWARNEISTKTSDWASAVLVVQSTTDE